MVKRTPDVQWAIRVALRIAAAPRRAFLSRQLTFCWVAGEAKGPPGGPPKARAAGV